MSGLWSELAKKIADQWFSLLVLPGVFYLAVTCAALILGHAHALDVGLLTRCIAEYAKNRATISTSGQIVLLAATLAGAAALGFAAQSIGTVLEQTALAAQWQVWPQPIRHLAQQLIVRRKLRWNTANAAYLREVQKALAPDPANRPDPAVRHRIAHARARIATEQPERPTWSGDRIQAVAVRLDRDYHLDLAALWPPLWLILPDTVRDQIINARTALSRATTLGAWSILYSVLTIWWWPAALLAVIIAATARRRTRAATETYATLLETSARLYSTTLATQLGIEHTGPLTTRLGRTLTHHLHTPPAPPPSNDP